MYLNCKIRLLLFLSLSPQVTLLKNRHFLLSSKKNLSPNLLTAAACSKHNNAAQNPWDKEISQTWCQELPSSSSSIQSGPWDILWMHLPQQATNSTAAHSTQATRKKSCNQRAEELCFFPANIPTLCVIPQWITLGISERARHTADTLRWGSPSESCSCLQTANPVQILAQGI